MCRLDLSFFLRSFVRWSLTHFIFSYVLLCVIVVQPFLQLFHNITINVKPLRVPIFEKIAPHFEHLVCSYLGSLRFILFVVNFPVPPPSPWTRLVPLLVDVGVIFDRSSEARKSEAPGL